MTLTPIIARIRADAEHSAQAIIADAEQKAQYLRDAAQVAANRDKQHAENDMFTQEHDIRDRLLRMAELDQRKALLAMKREMLNAAFDNAARRMLTMPLNDAKAFIMDTVVSAAQGGENLTPVGVSRDWLNQGCVDEINALLAEKGFAPLMLSANNAPSSATGGCILSRGGMRMVLTYEAILAGMRGQLESEVAELLFGEGR